MKTRRLFFRLATLACATLVLLPGLVQAANPFLNTKDDQPAAARFSGTEWNDEFEKEEYKFTARIVTQRVAQAKWGAIYKVTFTDLNSKAPQKREIKPWYFIATDDAIALLNEENNDEAAQKFAAQPEPPKFADDDLYGLSKGTKKWRVGSSTSEIVVKGDSSTYQYNHSSGHFTTVRWQKGIGLIEIGQGYGARKDGYRLKRELSPVKKK